MTRRAAVQSPPSPAPHDAAAPRRVPWLPWLLVAAVLLTFGPVVTHEFGPMDDADTIWANPRLNPPAFDSQNIGWYWCHEELGLYAPLTYTAWGLLAKATWVPTPDERGVHVDPRAFHAASLVVHAASVLLAYALLRRLFTRAWPAAIGALLFGLHPIQVEAVAWASGLKDLLWAMFALAALNLYVRSVLEPAPLRRGRYWLGLVCVMLGMLCKPTAMVTPLVAAAIDRMILRRSWRQVILAVIPWLIAVLPLAIVAKLVQPSAGIPTAAILQRPVVMGASLAFYLWKLFVPVRFAFDYGWRPPVMLHKSWFWGIALVPAALAVALWAFRRRWPWLAAGGLVAVIALLPVLGLTPFLYQYYSTVADHYAYLAMLGPALVATWLISRAPASAWRPAIAGSAVILAALAVLSMLELRHWRTEESALLRTLRVNPNSLLAHNGMGKVHQRRHELEAAKDEFSAAIRVDPKFLSPWENLVQVYHAEGRVNDAIAAVHALERIHETLPPQYRHDQTPRFLDLGVQSITEGRVADAIPYLEEYLKSHPDDAQARALLEKARESSRPKSTTTTRGAQ